MKTFSPRINKVQEKFSKQYKKLNIILKKQLMYLEDELKFSCGEGEGGE